MSDYHVTVDSGVLIGLGVLDQVAGSCYPNFGSFLHAQFCLQCVLGTSCNSTVWSGQEAMGTVESTGYCGLVRW